jgi:glycyl-tRNA synthetase
VSAPNIETIVSLSKRRGFVYPSSEIYGGLGSAWDYGPLGIELYNNVKQAWWRWMVYDRDDIEGLDSSIILNRLVWKYSGHEDTFNDWLVDCRKCKNRFRADKIGSRAPEENGKSIFSLGDCPSCGEKDWTEVRAFNTMLRTKLGAVADDDPNALAYLRPETAQGIFINFLNVLTSSHGKLPFGIAQTGKSIRNEVTPGNFILRTREFEQMEMEYFVRPEDEHSKLVDYWVEQYLDWLTHLGISRDNLNLYEVPQEELAPVSTTIVFADVSVIAPSALVEECTYVGKWSA